MTLARTAASVGGVALAATGLGVAALRHASKSLHPRGDVVRGRIFREGSPESTGVPWLDEPGEGDVVVRLSRAWANASGGTGRV